MLRPRRGRFATGCASVEGDSRTADTTLPAETVEVALVLAFVAAAAPEAAPAAVPLAICEADRAGIGALLVLAELKGS